MNNISYQCPTEFNVVTTLQSCDEYKKELQESMDPLKYKFDIRPGPMCYMPGQAFQGLRIGSGRQPPPQLLDMELTLQAMPLKEQDNKYIIKDIHNAKPPAMPKILSNRMIVPDCQEILGWQRTKIKRNEFPQVSHRMDKMGMYLTNYMRPGRDTRAEMRDAFRLYEKQKKTSSDVYGVGIFDPRALKPGTNPNCTNADSDLGCMHVYGPDAQRTTAVIDPTLTLNDLSGKQGIKGGNLDSPLTLEAKRVAQTLDQNIPYTDLLTKANAISNSCIARFYGYTPPNCK